MRIKRPKNQNLCAKLVTAMRIRVGVGIFVPIPVKSIMNLGRTKVVRTITAITKPTIKIMG